jgi:anaerobic C4-dicarboxylate transporter
VTNVVLFGKRFPALAINQQYFWVWATWLLASILLTLVYGVLLVLSSASSAHKKISNQQRVQRAQESNIKSASDERNRNEKKRKVTIFVTAFIVCIFLVFNAERQVAANCVLLGEDVQWGFGQVGFRCDCNTVSSVDRYSSRSRQFCSRCHPRGPSHTQ